MTIGSAGLQLEYDCGMPQYYNIKGCLEQQGEVHLQKAGLTIVVKASEYAPKESPFYQFYFEGERVSWLQGPVNYFRIMGHGEDLLTQAKVQGYLNKV